MWPLILQHRPVSLCGGLREHSKTSKTKAARPWSPKIQNLHNIVFHKSKQDSRGGKKTLPLDGQLYKISGLSFPICHSRWSRSLINTFFCFFIKSWVKLFQFLSMKSRTRWPLWHCLKSLMPRVVKMDEVGLINFCHDEAYFYLWMLHLTHLPSFHISFCKILY